MNTTHTTRKVGSNITERILPDGSVVLYSYATPVAAYVGGRFVRTNVWYSKTTTRHTNKWLGMRRADDVGTVDQQFLNSICKG